MGLEFNPGLRRPANEERRVRRRFFVEQFAGAKAVMEGEAAHHLGRVLRAQAGQQYELSDGERVFLGRIEVATRDRIEFLLEAELVAQKLQLDITLLLSVVKFDAFEWALEKATELGVSTIVPLAAARSEKGLLAAAEKRAERWRKILLEAAQQSRRLRVPVLVGLEKVEGAFAKAASGTVARVMLSELASAGTLRASLAGQRGPEVALAIGPEGGWTDGEFAAGEAAGFRQASLGRLILRTETAVIAALAAVNYALAQD
jgi:16S rRNA (uracil1498-N3)-methyltransferase